MSGRRHPSLRASGAWARIVEVFAVIATVALPPLAVLLAGSLLEPEHESPSDAMALYWLAVWAGACAALFAASIGVVVWFLTREPELSEASPNHAEAS